MAARNCYKMVIINSLHYTLPHSYAATYLENGLRSDAVESA